MLSHHADCSSVTQKERPRAWAWPGPVHCAELRSGPAPLLDNGAYFECGVCCSIMSARACGSESCSESCSECIRARVKCRQREGPSPGSEHCFPLFSVATIAVCDLAFHCNDVCRGVEKAFVVLSSHLPFPNVMGMSC